MEANKFQPIRVIFDKAASFVAASVLQAGEKHVLFKRLGDRGGDARRWLEVVAGLDEQSLRATLSHELPLVDGGPADSSSTLKEPQALG